VEAAIGRIIIFGLAGGAHSEGGHGSAGAVVRDILDDGETWTAIGAIDEGIVEAPVARAHHFAEAVIANGNVSGNEGSGRSIKAAGNDLKASFGKRLRFARKKRRDLREGRKFSRQTIEETFEETGLTLDLDGHAGGSIGDEAGEMAFLS
jgi:hypothetical protein